MITGASLSTIRSAAGAKFLNAWCAGSCTRAIRILDRDFCQSVCEVCIRRSSALASGFQGLVLLSLPARRQTSPAQPHDHYPRQVLPVSWAVATVAPDTSLPV